MLKEHLYASICKDEAEERSVLAGMYAWFNSPAGLQKQLANESTTEYFARLERLGELGAWPTFVLKVLSILPTSVLVEQIFSHRNKLHTKDKGTYLSYSTCILSHSLSL